MLDLIYSSGLPQCGQNLLPAVMSSPQDGQVCLVSGAAEIAKAASRRAYSLTAWTDQCRRLYLRALLGMV